MNRAMWKRVAVYGAALAAGALALEWLDYDRLAWSRPGEIYIALVAAAFLALGVFIGMRVFASPRAAPFDGNPRAVTSLGISPRELLVLKELAAGRSNKEIARRLEVSPNTVKTHVGRLYEKLGAERRTDAVNRARELGIIA
jgi:DNA-binding CsgD family transcriptional regulator